MSLDEPLVSVIICTRNRAESLGRTLDSIVVAAGRVRDRWELIVVDNGSTDHTSTIASQYADRLPLRLVAQPIPGLSNARNAGVSASQGRYVLWTDDDVLVDENWLSSWTQAFASGGEAVIFGGRTEPRYLAPEQTWFVQSESVLGSLLAVRDTPEWRDISEDRLPWGLNYAIRGAEQRSLPYDPELGVAPGRRRGGEEVALMRELLSRGGTGRWVWGATVYHLIPAERQTEQYIRLYYEADGFDWPNTGAPRGFTRVRGVLAAVRDIVKTGLGYRKARRRSKTEAVPWLVRNARAWGSLRRHSGVGRL